jgi:hypothetical protein
MTRLLIFILALGLGISACGDTRSEGDIRGRLVLRDEGSVADLNIELEGPMVSRTTTDSEGQYTFSDLPPGAYEMSTDLGLFSQEPSARVEVDVISGELTVAPDLVLTPAGAIRGRAPPGPAASQQ